MARIVLSGSSEQSREQMSRLLSSSGYPVFRLCGSAGELRRALNDCGDGLLILAGPLPGCSTDELCWDYGDQVQILLIARPPALEACEAPGIFRLALPTSRQTVIGAVEMLTQLHRMRLPKRPDKEKQLVDQAKDILMRKEHVTEPQAHRLLQEMAMNRGMRMAECAAKIVSSSKETEG